MDLEATLLNPAFLTYVREFVAESLEPESADAIARQIQSMTQAADKPDLAQALLRTFDLIGAQDDAVALGYRLGQSVPLTAFGSLTMILRLAPTPRDSFRLLCEHQWRVTTLVRYRFKENPNGSARFSVEINYPLGANARTLTLASIFSTLDKELSHSTNHMNNIESMILDSLSDHARQTFDQCFGIKPKRRKNLDAIELSAHVLDARNPAGDPVSFASQASEWTALAIEKEQKRPIAEVVRDQILFSLATPPDVETIASRLNLSRRQLNFSLEKAGTRYRDILRDCRVAYVRSRYLQSRVGVAELAEELGYSDASAFSHSFKRWTGETPMQFGSRINGSA